MQSKILNILKENSRLSNSDIAKMLDLDEQLVAKEIKKMEDEGVILKYSVVLNDNIMRDDIATAFIEVKIRPKRDEGFDHLANRIREFSEVRSVHLMSGVYDLLIEVQGKSLQEVAYFVSGKLATIDGVLSTTTHFLLKKHKENGIIMRDVKEKSKRINISF